MCYRCEICQQVMPPKTPSHRIVVATRPCTYPYRLNAHRDPIHHQPQRGEIKILTPAEAAHHRSRHSRGNDPCDDPGGAGFEIAKEVTACPLCWKALHGESPDPSSCRTDEQPEDT
jgi:hypothetical protein